MRIVVLYTEVGSYLIGVLREVAQQTGDTVEIIEWDRRNVNSTKFIPYNSSSIKFYQRSKFDKFLILKWLTERSPSIILVSGWMDKDYLWACRKYKNSSKVKIVAMIDDQWLGTLRQNIGSLYFRFFYKKIFDYMWVSGKPQFSYAQNFGYSHDKIISNCLSADTSIFNERSKLSKRFVFVGRFVKIKALDLLIEAYTKLSKETQNEWPLVLIGDGELRSSLTSINNSNIFILPFLQPNELKKELLKGGVGCLTSHKDQWGVVVHEYALLGLPLLVSTGCGTQTEFLISGYNGFLFKKGDVDSLHSALLKFTTLDNSQFKLFSDNSYKLGKKIDTQIAAASILSLQHL